MTYTIGNQIFPLKCTKLRFISFLSDGIYIANSKSTKLRTGKSLLVHCVRLLKYLFKLNRIKQKNKPVLFQGRSQTTFTRGGGQVVQKCLVFVNVHKVENLNAGGQVVKKGQKLVNVVCECPLMPISIDFGGIGLKSFFFMWSFI